MRHTLIFFVLLIGVVCCTPAVDEVSYDEDGNLGIVDGKIAKITKYPYVVSVSSNQALVGAGVILNKNWILTISFVYSVNQNATVRAGSNHWQDGGQVVGIEKIVQHPKYTSWTGDVALLKLSKPLKLGKKVKPSSLGSKKLAVGTSGATLGWGLTHSEAKDPSKVLKVAKNTVLDDASCQQVYSTSFGPTLFCSKAEDEGPSNKDFGGPFVVKNKVYGLFAGGYYKQGPRLYVNIPALADWIQETIKS